MHLVYIDDSRDEKLCVFSALAIPAQNFNKIFEIIKEFRKKLKEKDGIYIGKELHGWKLVSGRGRISDRIVTKWRRCQIFKEALNTISDPDNFKLFNAISSNKDSDRAFEYLLNRINTALKKWDSQAVLFIDEGKEPAYTRIARKLSVFNPIPSKYGRWRETGGKTKNIPLNRIIEDPVFKKSRNSYFIQMVDFCAYALLRRENQFISKNKYGIDKAFSLLSDILVREAARKDPEGILRL